MNEFLKYHLIKVKISSEDDKGRIKWRAEEYLVDSLSVTEAESKITTLFKDYSGEWKIHSVVQSKILQIL